MQIPLQYKDFNVLTIEVKYSKGGINYFSGSSDRRGIYCYVRPEKVEKYEGYATRSFIIGEERQYKFLLSEEKRLNRKKLAEFQAKVEKLNGEELKELYLAGSQQSVTQIVRNAVLQ